MYVHGLNMGYGRMGTMLAEALKARGVDVYDSLGDGPTEYLTDEATERRMAAKFGVDPVLVRDKRTKLTNTVCWASTPGHAKWWWQGQHPVLLTMFESRRLPEAFREHLHEFETLIVPSQQNVELFGQYHDDVQYMPLGIDPKVWHYVPRSIPVTRFNFLIGGSGARKGTDLAFEAFNRVFGVWQPSWGPEPHLVMKNPRGEDYGGPRVDMVTGKLSAEQEVAIYEEAHCYLQPSRGEGFGLQPLQAIAQGIPTILTGDHGHAAFAELGLPISSTPAKSGYFLYGDAGEWWEPSLDELCERMEDVYRNYEAHVARAHESAARAAYEFTWDMTAQRFEDILGERLTEPYSGNGEWYLPTLKLYEVRTNRDWVADIGGTVYHFAKGELVHAPADVKRVLFEANLLDPSCVDQDDHGLLPEQVEQAHHAKRRACPTCGVVAGRSRADELVEQYEALAPWQETVWKARDLLERWPRGLIPVGDDRIREDTNALLAEIAVLETTV
jgi:glycosyltransferase involved in cell wall biosynthesis